MIADDYHLKIFILSDKIEKSLEFGILVLSYIYLVGCVGCTMEAIKHIILVIKVGLVCVRICKSML